MALPLVPSTWCSLCVHPGFLPAGFVHMQRARPERARANAELVHTCTAVRTGAASIFGNLHYYLGSEEIDGSLLCLLPNCVSRSRRKHQIISSVVSAMTNFVVCFLLSYPSSQRVCAEFAFFSSSSLICVS